MITYSNAFNCVTDGNKSEVIMTFFQNTPVYTEDGEFDSMAQERISTVAMTSLMAKRLLDSLGSLLNDDGDNAE